MAEAERGLGIVSKKSPTLKLLLFIAPLLPTLIVVQSIAVSWVGPELSGSSPASRWALMLGPLCTLAAAVLGAAFGGPLLSDKIKKDAGILEKEQ